jgi:protein disulfide-isomerase A1
VSSVSASNLTEFKSKDRVVAVAFLNADDAKDQQVFSDFAESRRDSFVFGLANDADAATAAGVTAPALVLYRQFDEPEVKYTGKFDEAELSAFLTAESIPLIDEVGPENFMTYAEAGLPLAYYFTEPEDASREATIEALKPFAKEYKGKINLVWIDAVKFVNHAKGLNLRGEEWPSFVIQDIQGGTKFPLDNLGKDPAKTVGDWLKQYVDGKLKPSIKSEPVPKAQDGPVHVLVADEFDKVVFDDSKDVLVEFYAPWCGHCKNLAPIYDQLGEKYADSKDKLIIAKMDATANDVPPSAGFQVQSFPTIKFKPAGSKEFVDFSGDRSLDSFVDFLGLNAKNKVVAKDTTNDTGSSDSHLVHEEL